jgi:hypothetical protein
MTTIYSNTPQTISAFIPELNKNQIVSTQTVDNNKNIIYRSFKVYSFPNSKAKDIRLVQLGSYSPVYKSDSYFQITQEFIVDTYSSTQEVINNVLQPSFYTWEHTTTTLNYQRQLGNTEKLVVTWTPPTANLTPEQIGELTPQQIEQYLQPFNIQVGDVYGVTIPPNCTVLSPTNLNPNLLINVDTIRIKPLSLTPLSFSFRGVDVISLELPYKIVTDNPKLLYPKSLLNPPKVPPNITGLNTNFPLLEDTELSNYAARRSRSTAII